MNLELFKVMFACTEGGMFVSTSASLAAIISCKKQQRLHTFHTKPSIIHTPFIRQSYSEGKNYPNNQFSIQKLKSPKFFQTLMQQSASRNFFEKPCKLCEV